MKLQERKELLRCAVYRNQDQMYEVLDALWEHPETGFHEWDTHTFLMEKYRALGYEPTPFGNIPGFYLDIETGRSGPKLLYMGEMDALLLPGHSCSDHKTGAVHACGHNAQSAALLGLAAALKEPGVLENLSGSIRLMAVPAEEMIETQFRKTLQSKGLIRYLGGKTELIARGYMDNCDMAVVVHTYAMAKPGIRLIKGGNGCIVKDVAYIGKSAHAGSFPERGINALYAAELGMQAVNALRETFPDAEHIRFHPIITRGGKSVSSIPSDIGLESYVRGASVEALDSVNRKINRALTCAAAAIGADIRIEDLAGYLPLHNDRTLKKLTAETVCDAFGAEQLDDTEFWSGGCTDLGDVCTLMPAIQPLCSGASGTAHGEDYMISDRESAVVRSAQLQLFMIDRLLRDNAAGAREVIAAYKPTFANKDEFMAFLDNISKTYTPIHRKDDASMEINLS